MGVFLIQWLNRQFFVRDKTKINMKIPLTKIKSKINIPINDGINRIEQIKREISAGCSEAEKCEVEVYDMWEEEDE